MADKKRTIALERREQVYLKPYNATYFNAYTNVNGMGRSEALNFIVKFFIDSLPATERERLLVWAKENGNIQESTIL